MSWLERPALGTLLAALAVNLLSALLSPAEDRLFDAGFRLRRDPGWPEGLVAVPIDDSSVREGGRWPWPRAKLAELIHALRAQGARTIALDVLLAGTQDAADDAALEEALAGVLIPAARADGGGSPEELVRRHLLHPGEARVPHVALEEILLPAHAFANAAGGVGHAIFLTSRDRRVRTHVPFLEVRGAGAYLPSMPLLAVSRHLGIAPEALRIDALGLRLADRRVRTFGGAVYVSISKGAAQPPRVPAHEVLAGNDRAHRLLADSLAVVYVDTADSPDRVATLASPATPGGRVVIESMRVLLGGATTVPISRHLALGVSIVMLLACGRHLARATPSQVLYAAGAAVLATLAAGAALIRFFDMLLPALHVTAFLAAAGIAHAFRTGRRMERERRELAALVAASKSDPATSHPTIASPAPVEDRPLTAEMQAGGLRLGRYRVVSKLGQGGMGSVFLAFDEELKREVALKILTGGDRAALARFRQEAATVARISHPNVVQIHDVALDAETPYLVMEFCRGGTLSERLTERDGAPLPWRDATRVVLDAARGLGAAHRRGIVHRDVKPANVLLVSPAELDAKIGDFGIAKLVGTAGPTQEGAVVGTFSYMSPEQAQGQRVDARSDVFALGLTWFRILTGKPAYEGTPSEIVIRLLTQEVRDPRELAPALPAEAVEVLRRMTAREPKERFADGDQAAAALADLLASYMPKASSM